MELQPELTEEEDTDVKEYCDKVDKYLEAFKRRPDLKTATNTDGWMIIKDILDLNPGIIKTGVTKNLSSRGELFEIFTLAWKSRVKGYKSSSIDMTTVSSLSECIGNLTVVSDEICLAFGEKGLLRILLDDLKTGNLDDDLTRTALTIAYSCCRRVPENQVMCREYIDVFHALSQSEKPNIQADAFLALSYIVDKLDVQRLALDEACVKFLMLHMKSSMSKSKKKTPTQYHYSVLEITKGINQLVINETNKLLFAEHGGLDLLLKILVEGTSTDEERLCAARGIWQLAFKEENKAKIRRIKTLVTTLKKIRKTTKNLGIREACSGALFMVNDVIDDTDEAKEKSAKSGEASSSDGKSTDSLQKSSDADRKSSGSLRKSSDADRKSSGSLRKSSAGEHIMISYQWASQKRMLQVKKFLEKRGYNVWMDVERMQGNILNTMAEAVQNASVVLVCASQKYSESQNCRTEAQYAYKQKKDVIPLMMEDKFEPRGWLGALMGMDMYFPVFSENIMKKTLPNLVKELGERGKREEIVIPELEEVTGGSGPSPSPVDTQVQEEDVKPNTTTAECSGGVKDDKQTDKKNKDDSRLQKMFTAVKSKVPLLDRP